MCVGVLASPRIIVLNSLMISIRPSAERGSSSVFVVVVVAACGCVVVVLAENDKYYDELLSGGCAATAAADTIAADRMICDDMRVDARGEGGGRARGAFVAIAVSYIRLCAHGNGIGNGGRASHRTSARMAEHDLCVDNTGGGCGSLVLWRASAN